MVACVVAQLFVWVAVLYFQVVLPRSGDHLRDEVGPVAGGRLQLEAGELLGVGVLGTCGVLDLDRTRAAGGVLVSVHALHERVIDTAGLLVGASAGDLDLAVALPASPRQVLVLGDAVRLGLTPGCAALVVVPSDQTVTTARAVGLDDLRDETYTVLASATVVSSAYGSYLMLVWPQSP